MARAEDIPQSLWEKAEQAAWKGLGTRQSSDIEVIAKAILSAVEEEREACAVTAENWEGPEVLLPLASVQHNEGAATGMYEASERIATAIRQRKGN